jgi:hypothetical protein
MLCAAALTVYACSNFSGTTCNKVTLNTVQTYSPTASGECAPGQFVLLTPSEFAWATESPFRLSSAEAGAIGAAILSVLAAAWAVRAVVRTIYGGNPET